MRERLDTMGFTAQRARADYAHGLAEQASARARLADIQLPPNIRTILLPPSVVGSNYPTTGPQGVSRMEVNGIACSIELYLGQDALSDGAGGLRPVRWTGWDSRMGRYQGAVEGKAQVEERFFAILAQCASPAEARLALPDLAAVVDKIAGICADPRDAPKRRDLGTAPRLLPR